jgi:hypothetical protein
MRDVVAALAMLVLTALAPAFAPLADGQVSPPSTPTPPTESQELVTSPPILKVLPTTVVVAQGGQPTIFVTSTASAPIVSLVVDNSGGRAWNVSVVAYPVAYADHDGVKSFPHGDSVLDCRIWTVPGVVKDTQGNTTDGLANVWVQLANFSQIGGNMVDSHGDPLRGFLYQVAVNVMPDGSTSNTPCGGSLHYNTAKYGCDPRTPTPQGTPDATCTGSLGNGESDLSDNTALVSLVRDAKLSWSLDATTTKWCRGDSGSSGCDTDWAHGMPTGAPYNSARVPADTTPDSTYFQAKALPEGTILDSAGDSAPWQPSTTQLLDLAASACNFGIAPGQVYADATTTFSSTTCPLYDPQFTVLATPGSPGENATMLTVPENPSCRPCSKTPDAAGEYTFDTMTLPILAPVNITSTGYLVTTTTSTNFNTYYGLAGDWNAQLTLQNASMVDPGTSSVPLSFHVVSPDFVARLGAGQPGTTQAAPLEYPSASPIDPIYIFANLTNVGDGSPWVFHTGSAPTLQPVSYLITIDNNSNLLRGGTWGSATASGDPHGVSATFDDLTSDPKDGTRQYIGPGQHEVCVMVDMPDAINESDESTASNVDCMPIYFTDGSLPTVSSPRVTAGPYYNDTGATNPHDSFANASLSYMPENITVSFNVNASDTDQDHLNVSVIATLTDDTGKIIATRSYFPCLDALNSSTLQANCMHVRGDSDAGYAANVTGFGFARNDTVENWTLMAIATDGLGHNVTAPTTLQVQRWPIQSLPQAAVVYGVCSERNASKLPGTSNCSAFYGSSPRFSFHDNSTEVSYHIHLEDAWTGNQDQWNSSNGTGLVTMTIQMPGNQTFQTNAWAHSSECATLLQGVILSCPDAGNLTSINLTALRAPQGPGGVGTWNVSISVRDAAHRWRTFTDNVTFYDFGPNVTDARVETTALEAGGPIGVDANVTDDFGLRSAFVNFTRLADGSTVSVPLTGPRNVTDADGNVSQVYNDTIPTGQGAALRDAGTYNVTFAAVDTNGNWVEDPTGENVTIYDNDTPVLSDVTASARTVEAGENVTFSARASDDANTTVVLQALLQGRTILQENFTENGTVPGLYTLNASFDVDGTYTYRVWAVDSGGHTSPAVSQLLFVVADLPPRFDVLSPAIVGTQRYANASPTIQIFASDVNNVSVGSFQLVLDGSPVPSDAIRAEGLQGETGVLFSYVVPQAYANGQTIQAHASVEENGPNHFVGSMDLQFTIDATPPVAQVVSEQPAYPSGAVTFVSPSTTFTLGAMDPGDASSGIASLTYRLCVKSCAGAHVEPPVNYRGPFSLLDDAQLPGSVYGGAGLYELDVIATDNAGNQNRSQPLFLQVDDAGPTFDALGSQPEPPYVNVSFDDPGSGVDHAVVLWRAGDGPYASIPLVMTDGLWRGVITDVKKGETIGFHLEAWDRVGNFVESYSPEGGDWTYSGEDHAPTLQISSPADGASADASRGLRIAWSASDPDGDRLTYLVSERPHGSGSFVQLAQVTNGSSEFEWDTTGMAPGDVDVRVVASDGVLQSASVVTVTILVPPQIALGAPLPSVVRTGDTVTITAQVDKANATVVAEILRDGATVGLYPMHDDGRAGDAQAGDGVYTATIQVQSAGAYTVAIHAQYTEGGHEQSADLANAAAFSVRLSPAGALSEYLWPVVIACLVGLLLVLFAAWRYRQRT